MESTGLTRDFNAGNVYIRKRRLTVNRRIFASDYYQIGIIVRRRKRDFFFALVRRTHTGDYGVQCARLNRGNKPFPCIRINFEFKTETLGDVIGNLNVVAVGVFSRLIRYRIAAVCVGILSPIVRSVVAFHTDLKGISRRRNRAFGALVRRIFVDVEVYHALHQRLCVIVGKRGEICVYVKQKRIAFFNTDGNRGIGLGRRKTGGIVFEVDVTQFYRIAFSATRKTGHEDGE